MRALLIIPLLAAAPAAVGALRLGEKKEAHSKALADPMVIVSPEIFPWHRNVQPFRALDDLDPDAPMDVVAPEAVGEKRGFSLYPKMLGWNSSPNQQAAVIPAYSRPEAFPSEAALQNADRKGKLNYHWFRRVPAEVTQDSGVT